jgi:hypothetical protein
MGSLRMIATVMRRSPSQPYVWFLIAMVAWLLVACADSTQGLDEGQATEAGIFIGDVAGTTAMVGLVHNDDTLAAYVCGREDTLASYTRWFNGSLDDDGATFTLDSDGWSLSGSLEASGVEATLVDPDGASASLSLVAAATDSLSGLYSVLDGDCRAGLIVSDPGTSTAIITQGAWCDGDGVVKQVTPMMPVGLVDGGIAVTVDDTAPEQALTMAPHGL